MSIEANNPKYNEYDSSKKISQQIEMTETSWNQLKRVSPFDMDTLDIINIFPPF